MNDTFTTGQGLNRFCPSFFRTPATTCFSLVFQTQVKEGNMVCGGCGHIYKITQGIPNMLLNEDEV
jgi:uncharacterized protein YbaR (Trm112 family)